MTNHENGYSFWAEQSDAVSNSIPEPASTHASDNAASPLNDSESLNEAAPSVNALYSENTTASDYSAWQENAAASEHSSLQNSTAAATSSRQRDTTAVSNSTWQSDTMHFEASVQPEKKTKNRRFGRALKKTVGFVAAAAVFGCVAGASFIGFNALYYHLNPSARPDFSLTTDKEDNSSEVYRPVISSTSVAQGTTITTTDVSGIVDSAMPSLVSISCTFRTSTSFFGYLYEGTTEGSGSGIIVGSNDTELLIATNNHVIDDAVTISVTFADGSSLEATTKGTDSANDLAIISVPLDTLEASTRDAISIATLGSSDDVKVGQMVVAIGNAMGYGQTTTVGYISAKEREITVSDSSSGSSTKMTALQVDAAINPGNSGGALLNVNGEVIGINSAKLSDTAVEGIGYAIPISNVLDILTELMNREVLSEDERGYLGVYLSQQDITAEVSAVYGWPIGVYVTETTPNGAGAKYGILAGDIITGINGTTITSYAQLQEKVTSYRSGTTISVTLQRMEDGIWQEHVLEVVLGSKADFDTEE